MRVTCTNCGGAHTPWDCKRPAKKSRVEINPKEVALRVEKKFPIMMQELSKSPVDTKASVAQWQSRQMIAEDEGSIPSAGKPQKRSRGRPKSITDMAAYKRAKQREYRAKWKGSCR